MPITLDSIGLITKDFDYISKARAEGGRVRKLRKSLFFRVFFLTFAISSEIFFFEMIRPHILIDVIRWPLNKNNSV